MRLRSLAVMFAAVIAFQVVPVSAGSAPAAAFNSQNMTHIKNIPQVNVAGQSGGGGSDIEFTSIDVTDIPEGEKPEGATGVHEFALGGSLTKGMQIYDITDPENTELVSIYDCKLSQGDIQVFQRDGRTLATYTADYGQVISSECYRDAKGAGYSMGNNLGTFIVDLSNPYQPETVSFINLSKGSHNMTVHPGGLYLYNSNNELTGGVGAIEIVDISDVTAPKMTKTVTLTTGIDSHDISFNADGTRAYSAAINHSLVFDTTDPANPVVIGRIVDPSITIHHQSEPVTMDTPLGERDFLVVTDEVGGGSYGSVCPGGAIHVFDITGDLERSPVKVGVFEAPVVKPAGGGTDQTGSALGCTSHVLRFYPEQKIMTIAWYNAGTHVVDISSMIGPSVGATIPTEGGPTTGSVSTGMKELGYYWFPDSNTWSAKTNAFEEDGSFFVYSNDINRGLDIFRFDASAPTAAATGSWYTPAQYKQVKAQAPKVSWKSALPFCILNAENSKLGR